MHYERKVLNSFKFRVKDRGERERKKKKKKRVRMMKASDEQTGRTKLQNPL